MSNNVAGANVAGGPVGPGANVSPLNIGPSAVPSNAPNGGPREPGFAGNEGNNINIPALNLGAAGNGRVKNAAYRGNVKTGMNILKTRKNGNSRKNRKNRKNRKSRNRKNRNRK